MPIEFLCPGCEKQLRVDDSAAGKKARCPQCNAVVSVPAAPGGSEQAPPVSPPGAPLDDVPPMRPDGPVNPYMSPRTVQDHGKTSAADGPINHRILDVGEVMSHAWQLWQDNLGLLVGAVVVIALIGAAVATPFSILQAILTQQRAEEAAVAVNLLGNMVNQVVSIYLGIGFAQLCLRLARGQHAEFAQIFGGGSRFLPVLGVSILLGLAIGLGFLACIVPGIVLSLMWWPAYYLVVDEKADVMESFGVASRIATNNWATAFVLGIISFGIILLGLLVLCVGVLFAAPLVSMIWISAYLMMSGQLDPPSKPA